MIRARFPSCATSPMLSVTFEFVAFAALAIPQAPSLGELPQLDRGPFEGSSVDYLVEAPVENARAYRSAEGRELVLDNGLIRRIWRLEPNAACVAFDDLRSGRSLLRAVRPEARVQIDGTSFDIGGLMGQPNHAFLTDEWLDGMTANPDAMQLVDFELGPTRAHFEWKRVRHHAPNAAWPPPGIGLRLEFAAKALPNVTVFVHYELYDNVPVLCKWISVHNDGDTAITVDRFASEILAVVEAQSWVETREGVSQPPPRYLHVETDFAFGGMSPSNANRHVVHWRPDPLYTSQVNYLLQTPCLLEVEPTYGPSIDVAPGESFESQRTYELVHDSSDRERRGLELRRMYRTVAPWVTENPLMMHMRTAQPEAVRDAIDQCARVGFEMLILSFGSGFNIEDESDENIALWKDIADRAHEKGIEIGGYSLLSSRRIGGGNDVVSPEGSSPTHGHCPALTSEWGRDYYRKLYAFFERTGFELLEHDGPYPGDVDVTPRPPIQKGLEDSRWLQWRIASNFYRWCREQGIYLNTPDYYYLAGSTKCAMGYREVNWSLPRAQQVIHTRQNIFDGTWTKTPSMGWMFVPLTEYQGGGAAATIEPLSEHRDHYRRMIESNLSLGVQACYRGPRLYDSPETEALVKAQVDWFKAHRDILESDLIHGRRADGRDVDWMLHVGPTLDEKGMLLVFNPLEHEVTRTLDVNLYYTGLTKVAKVSDHTGAEQSLELARDYGVEIEVSVPAGGMRWFVIR